MLIADLKLGSIYTAGNFCGKLLVLNKNFVVWVQDCNLSFFPFYTYKFLSQFKPASKKEIEEFNVNRSKSIKEFKIRIMLA